MATADQNVVGRLILPTSQEQYTEAYSETVRCEPLSELPYNSPRFWVVTHDAGDEVIEFAVTFFGTGGGGGVLSGPDEGETEVTADAGERVILVDATDDPVTVNLYDHTEPGAVTHRVKKTDAGVNAVTISVGADSSIDGSSSYVLSAAYESVDLVPTPSGWWSF